MKMYINKKDKEHIQRLVFKDYCLCCNTRNKALKEGDNKTHDDLINHELYLHDLLINKFGMSEKRLCDMQSKMYLNDTY